MIIHSAFFWLKIIDMAVINTGRTVLRKARFSDWKDMYERVWSDDELYRFLRSEPSRSEAEAKDRMLRTIAFQERNEHMYLVCDRDDDRPVGYAGLEKCGDDAYQEMGIVICRSYQRRGIGAEVLDALTDYAFSTLGGKIFYARHFPDNKASAAMQMKCGFRFLRYEDDGIVVNVKEKNNEQK